jgi:threonine-phosphate decarboxylase
MEIIHGGDITGYEAIYNRKPVDFSANLSPLGMPESVRRAIRDSVSEAEHYPDPLCRRLRDAISEVTGVPAQSILCGNGAADLIYRAVFAIKPKTALLPAPTFTEYETALESAGCNIVRYYLSEDNDFDIDRDFLEYITPETDTVFLCQPNNPTGRAIPKPLLLDILARCREVGAQLVTDESFAGFLNDPDRFTMMDEIGENRGLVVIRSFTKIYAMAGVRLGYCVSSDSELLNKMYSSGQPWGVSTSAQAAGIAAVKESEYVLKVRETVKKERLRLINRLTGLGLRVIPGEANYLLFKCGVPLSDKLLDRGILIRSCGNFHGLDGSWYRIAVRTERENEMLIRAIGEVLSGG